MLPRLFWNNFYATRQRWQAGLVLFWSLRSHWWYLGLGLACNLVAWGLAWWIVSKAGSQPLILRYNIVLGVDLIGDATQIYWRPAIAGICWLINWLLAWALFSRDKIVSQILLLAGFLVNLIVAATLILLFIVNFK